MAIRATLDDSPCGTYWVVTAGRILDAIATPANNSDTKASYEVAELQGPGQYPLEHPLRNKLALSYGEWQANDDIRLDRIEGPI